MSALARFDQRQALTSLGMIDEGLAGLLRERQLASLRRQLGYRSAQVIAYVTDYIAIEGVAPSYDIIGEALCMSKAKVCETVGRLEKRGLLSRVGAGRCRRIRLGNRNFITARPVAKD